MSTAATSAETVHRRTAPAAGINRAKELGVAAFAVVMRHMRVDAASVCECVNALKLVDAPLRTLADNVARMPDCGMYADWSPPKDRPSTEASIPPSAASASSKKGDEFAAAQALGDTPAGWLASTGRSAWWAVDLGARREVSSLSITLRKTAMPESVTVEVADGAGPSGAWTTVQKIADKAVKEDMTVTLPPGTFGQRVRFTMNGHATGNSDNAIGINRVRVWTYVEQSSYTPALTALRSLSEWLVRVVDGATRAKAAGGDAAIVNAAQDTALRALIGLARASGALSILLRLCRLLLAAPNHTLSRDTAAAGRALLLAMQTAILEQDKHASEAEYHTASSGGEAAGPAYGPLAAAFDSAAMSSGITLSNDNKTAASSSSGNSHAILNVGPFTEGKASWEFKLDEDTSSQCSCFGAAIKPVENSNYEYSSQLYMYRAYNGYRYSLGTCMSSGLSDSDKVRKNDTIRFELDMDERDGIINAYINGRAVSSNPVFTGLRGKEIWPAVAFYSSGRTISVVSVEGPLKLLRSGVATASKSSGRQTASLTNCPVGATQSTNLADIPEDHVVVGHGAFGKNGDLGYGKSGDERKVKVSGATVQQSLSMHPPAGGTSSTPSDAVDTSLDAAHAPKAALLKQAAAETSTRFSTSATAVYWLGAQHETFSGSVALNDSATTDARNAPDASPVYFEVYGDRKLLWRSSPFHVARSPAEPFEISVLGVQVLRLVTRCVAGNSGAHAVWMNPSLSSVSEWTYRGWRNSKSAMVDAVTGARRKAPRGVPAPQELGLVSGGGTPEKDGVTESKHSESKDVSDVSGDLITSAAAAARALDAPGVSAWVSSAHGLAHACLVYLGLLAEEHLREMRAIAATSAGSTTVDLESPFAVEASGVALQEALAVFNELPAAVKSSPVGDAATLSARQAARAAAGIVRAATGSVRRALTSGLALIDTGLALPPPKPEKKGGINKAKGKDLDTSPAPAAKVPEDATCVPDAPLAVLSSRLTALAAWGGHAEGKLVAAAGATASAPSEPVFAAESVQSAIWDFINLARDMVVTSKMEQTERLRALTSGPGIVELELQFPCEAFDDEGNFVSLETALLQLQLQAHAAGWRTRLLGQWPAKVFLVVDVPTSVASFLESELSAIFSRLDLSSWWKSLLGAGNDFPVAVERTAAWDRVSRSGIAPGYGAVHAYPATVASFDEVVSALQAFLPPVADEPEDVQEEEVAAH